MGRVAIQDLLRPRRISGGGSGKTPVQSFGICRILKRPQATVCAGGHELMAFSNEKRLNPTAPWQARVFVVDDSPLVRRGFRLLFGLEPDLTVCGEAGGATQAFADILKLKPDLAVVDLSIEEGTGLELIRRLRTAVPGLKIMVFSLHNDAAHVRAACRAGADAFVPKDEGTERAVQTLRTLLRGRRAVRNSSLSVTSPA
jgi:CheY-like chemotaxis protein